MCPNIYDLKVADEDDEGVASIVASSLRGKVVVEDLNDDEAGTRAEGEN